MDRRREEEGELAKVVEFAVVVMVMVMVGAWFVIHRRTGEVRREQKRI